MVKEPLAEARAAAPDPPAPCVVLGRTYEGAQMGELVRLDGRRARAHSRRSAPTAAIHFDLACPFSYLALERVDRGLPGVRWRPSCAEALHRGNPWADDESGAAAREAAARRAHELHLPLSWPADHPRKA